MVIRLLNLYLQSQIISVEMRFKIIIVITLMVKGTKIVRKKPIHGNIWVLFFEVCY